MNTSQFKDEVIIAGELEQIEKWASQEPPTYDKYIMRKLIRYIYLLQDQADGLRQEVDGLEECSERPYPGEDK